MRSTRGVTLIELLVVGVLVSLLTGLGLGLSRVYHHAVSASFAGQVLHFLHYARSEAMARDRDILFSIEGSMLVLRVKSPEELVSRMRIPAAVDVWMNRTSLGFTSYGYSINPGTITVKSGRFERDISLGFSYGRLSLY